MKKQVLKRMAKHHPVLCCHAAPSAAPFRSRVGGQRLPDVSGQFADRHRRRGDPELDVLPGADLPGGHGVQAGLE